MNRRHAHGFPMHRTTMPRPITNILLLALPFCAVMQGCTPREQPGETIPWSGAPDDQRARCVAWLEAMVELEQREEGRDLLDPGTGRRRGVRASDLRSRKTLQAVEKDVLGYLSWWNAEVWPAQRPAEHVVSEGHRAALHAHADLVLSDHEKFNVRSDRPLFRKELDMRLGRIAKALEVGS